VPRRGHDGGNRIGDPGDIRAVFTIFEGCWMDSYDYTFNNENVVVTENCGIQVNDIYDGTDSVYGMFMNSGNSPNTTIDATGASMIFAGEK